MTREEFEFLTNINYWPKGEISFYDEIEKEKEKVKEKTKEKEDVEGLVSSNEFEIPKEPKFKMAVKRVLAKIKLMAKGLFIEETLPDPEELPIESPNVTSFRANKVTKESPFSADFQGILQEQINLNHVWSSKGFCILYRDVKTKCCKVEEISNEFSCRGFFEWFSCYYLMPDSARIIIFDVNLKITKAFYYLLQASVRAAPIWDNERNEFVAMLTITDFIQFLHKYYFLDIQQIENLEFHTIKDWINILNIYPTKRLIHISPECSLKNAVRTIVENNIHRLPIVDPFNGNILGIITNSQLFRFFYKRFSMHFTLIHPDYMSKTPAELGLGKFSNNISTIYLWQTVYEAFDIFSHNQISVIPVLDKDHRLIDIFARYDVIALTESENYKNLDFSISKALVFRKLIRPPCTCNKEDSLLQIMENIYKSQVHRVFIVDEERRILGVISLSDILAFLCEL